MPKLDGFQTTDSFRFDRHTSSSSTSLSSSSGYGSRLSLSPTDQSSSNRRSLLTKYFKEKLSRHKSSTSLLLSSTTRTEINNDQTDIYDHVWNLEEQIDKLRVTVDKQLQLDSQSIISMSVDTPKPIRHRIDDHDLLSAAAWYQEGLPANICEEYLLRNDQPIGSFFIRCNYHQFNQPFILSLKLDSTSIQHFLIRRIKHEDGYQIQGSAKTFVNLSTLVIHHTVMREILPVTLVLPLIHSTLNMPQQFSLGISRSVRF